MICPSCSTANAPESRYCDNCGKALRSASRSFAPSPHPPVAGVRRTNGMAVASLVLGIVWIYGIGSILALVFGYVGRNQIDQSGGVEAGRGLATAGIVLGWIGVGLLLYWVAVVGALLQAIGA